jgi:hypothetical protein
LIVDLFHLHHLEILSPHFESRNPSYVKEVNARLKRAHSRIANIPIDVPELWNQAYFCRLLPSNVHSTPLSGRARKTNSFMGSAEKRVTDVPGLTLVRRTTLKAPARMTCEPSLAG